MVLQQGKDSTDEVTWTSFQSNSCFLNMNLCKPTATPTQLHFNLWPYRSCSDYREGLNNHHLHLFEFMQISSSTHTTSLCLVALSCMQGIQERLVLYFFELMPINSSTHTSSIWPVALSLHAWGGGGGGWAWPIVTYTFFLNWISAHIPVPLLGQGSVHSGSVSWDDCGQEFLGKSCVSLFPWWVLTLCLDSTISPLWLQWVIGVHVFHYNLPPALLAQWRGSFMLYWGGMETEIRVSTECLLCRKQFSHRSCCRSNLRHSDSESGTLQLSVPPPPLWLIIHQTNFQNVLAERQTERQGQKYRCGNWWDRHLHMPNPPSSSSWGDPMWVTECSKPGTN